jgi:hypothetical protein
MLRTGLTAFALVLMASAATAKTLTPEDFIHRHMDFAAKGDANAIANDFARDGVSVSATGDAVGRDAIRAQFQRLVGGRKGGGGGMGAMKVDRIWSQGNVGFINWESGPIHAHEVFVIKDNKIQSQSVFMSGGPPAPPPAK